MASPKQSGIGSLKKRSSPNIKSSYSKNASSYVIVFIYYRAVASIVIYLFAFSGKLIGCKSNHVLTVALIVLALVAALETRHVGARTASDSAISRA